MTETTEPTPAARQNAEADLAFLRGIVESSDRDQTPMGVLFLAGGLLYGGECLFHLGQIAGIIRWPDWASLTFVVLITVVMLGVVAWAVRYGSQSGIRSNAKPTASRAINGAFGGTGAANLAMIIVFGFGATRDHDFAVWLYYPAVVFAFQFVAWFMAWQLKRKRWMGLLALGHWTTAVALGLLVRQPVGYLMVATAALFLLFALPGWVILREARAGRTMARG